MKNINFKSCLFKTIGFINFNQNFYNGLILNGYIKKEIDAETQKFLQNSYHLEYLRIMFSNEENGVQIITKQVNHQISIIKRKTIVELKGIKIFIFNNDYESTKTAIFTLDFSPSNNSLDEISNISNDLKNHDCEISFDSKVFLLKDFISNELFFDNHLFESNSSLQQYAGNKFKNYLILDFDKEDFNRDHLLYELGTSSTIGTIKQNSIEAPSFIYINKILENKISCFNNYECLTLLNSFTVVGSNNFDAEYEHTYSTWNDIYFSIYIYNLYIKSSLQILLNDFTSDPINKRKEFQKFYNKYYFKKISYNFLPNEIFKGIVKSLEIEEDIEFIQNRLETLAIQVNEKQQKNQEFLLSCISILALLETPIHIDGIRELIGVHNIIIYNSFVYPSIVLTLIMAIFFRFRNKNK